jgi:hypothetical protein
MAENGCPDAKYTRKSAMYRAIAGAASEGNIIDVLKNLCAHIPGLRMADIEELQQCLGGGWPEREQYVKDATGKLLDPNNPFP